MSTAQVLHHLSLLKNPFSGRLRNYTTTVSISLYCWQPSVWAGEEGCYSEDTQKDEATASILRLLTNLSQIEINFPPFSVRRWSEPWAAWAKTIAALEESGSAADGASRPFIRAIALHAIRPSMDPLLGRLLRAVAPNLNALVLPTDSNHIYKAKDADFAACWAAIHLHAANLATLVISGVPVTTPDGPWACAQSLRSLDIASPPGLTPKLAYELICQFPGLRNVALQSIRLRIASILPPRDAPYISTYTGLPIGTPTTPEASVGAETMRTQSPISLQSLSLSSLDIDFVAALTSLGTTTLHLQVIHRSTTLLHLLKQPSAFVGLSRMVVGNEEGMQGGIFGWLGSEEMEELKAVCKERGCTFEDERFSRGTWTAVR